MQITSRQLCFPVLLVLYVDGIPGSLVCPQSPLVIEAPPYTDVLSKRTSMLTQGEAPDKQDEVTDIYEVIDCQCAGQYQLRHQLHQLG